MRGLICCVLLWLPAAVWAQADVSNQMPVIEITFDQTETIPGQPLTLRLTILVPTYMPTAPVWPTFETPNLMVRLPTKSSSPTSKTLNGQTWAGISRRYQITPVVAGEFVLPNDSVKVTYAAPDGGEPLVVELSVPSLSVTGVVPQGAESMIPFVAAQALTLSQDIEGAPDSLQAGGSFARILRVKVQGLAPMFLPSLTPASSVAGLRAYPESPGLQETESRGVLSGSREEKTVYLAETALSGVLPEVSFDWYNLKTKQIETVSLPEVMVVSVAAPDAPRPPADWRDVMAWGASVAGITVLFLLIRRLLWPHLARWHAHWRARRRAHYLASAQYAWKNLRQAVQARDLGQTRQNYEIWAARGTHIPQTEADLIEAKLLDLGRARFAKIKTNGEIQHWLALEGLFHRVRRRARYHRRQKPAVLPSLNPTSFG